VSYNVKDVEATVRSVVIVCASVLLFSLACSKTESAKSGESPKEDGPSDPNLPPFPVVKDNADNLLFSFVDAQGRVQAVPRVDAVPETVRSRVLVVDLSKTPEQRQAHKYAFFVDLTAKAPDDTYPVTVVSRYDAAKGQTAAPMAPPPEGSVLVYSAVWCGFCKKAKAWLNEKGVPYIERDVEKMPGAQAELQEKLKRANVPGGGIPVIDWGGSIVMGFDVPALERLLKEKPPTGNLSP
jgi:glutaredoxin